MIGNNLSALGIKAAELDRNIATRRLGLVDADDARVRPARAPSATASTTTKLATRFGVSSTRSPENRFRPTAPDNARQHARSGWPTA